MNSRKTGVAESAAEPKPVPAALTAAWQPPSSLAAARDCNGLAAVCTHGLTGSLRATVPGSLN